MDTLLLIVTTFSLALGINLLLHRFQILPIVGYLLTGMIVALFLELSHTHLKYLAEIAEFGIVFLMFTIGLEFSVSHLKKMTKEVFVYGTLQVIVTTTLFTLCWLTGCLVLISRLRSSSAPHWHSPLRPLF